MVCPNVAQLNAFPRKIFLYETLAHASSCTYVMHPPPNLELKGMICFDSNLNWISLIHSDLRVHSSQPYVSWIDIEEFQSY